MSKALKSALFTQNVMSADKRLTYSQDNSLPWIHTRLVFLIGNFNGGEVLRQGLCWTPPNPDLRDQREWIEATFAAYQPPTPDRVAYNSTWDRQDPVVKATAQDAFYVSAQRENKALLITRAVQDGIRERIMAGNPVADQFGIVPAFEHGGIIQYNHALLKDAAELDEARGFKPMKRRVLSVVVDEEAQATYLEGIVGAEFGSGADVVMAGTRSPAEYLALIRAWFSGTVSPNKFENLRFNPDRFAQGKNGLLSPTHSYDLPSAAKPSVQAAYAN